LTAQAEHNLAAITSHAVVKATELVDSVVDDLLIVDSQNTILLRYLSSFEDYLAISGNQTKEVLQAFYDIVDVYLDADAAEKTSRIETQFIAFCLQRNGFDRWKRTIQLRTSQLLKSFGTKLKRYADPRPGGACGAGAKLETSLGSEWAKKTGKITKFC